MLSYFRVFLQITDQIRACGSSIRDQAPRLSPLRFVEMKPTCQSAGAILGLVVETRGEEEQTWRIKRVFGLGAVAAFLHVSLSSSADVSLCTFSRSLAFLPPTSISISCSSVPSGVVRHDRWCFPDVLALNAALCVPGLTKLLSSFVPITHFSSPHRC